MSLTIGNKAPDFKLFDTNRKEISLSEFKDKIIVLAFFPGAFTGTCTREMCTIRDSMTNLNNLNAHVIAISVDGPFSNKAFAETNNLNFPILSDYTKQISKMYCVLYNDFANMKNYSVSKRSIFVIDRQGVIKYIWISEDSGKEPPYEEIINAISLLQAK